MLPWNIDFSSYKKGSQNSLLEIRYPGGMASIDLEQKTLEGGDNQEQFLLIKIIEPSYKRLGSRSILDLSHKRFGSGLILEPSYKRQQLNSWLRLTIVADQCQHRVSQTLLPTAQLNTNGRRSLRVYRKKINMRWNSSARHSNQGSSFKKVPKLCIGFSPPAAGVLASTWNSFKHSKIGSLFSFSAIIEL